MDRHSWRSLTRLREAIKEIGRALSVKPSKTTHFDISVEIENSDVYIVGLASD